MEGVGVGCCNQRAQAEHRFAFFFKNGNCSPGVCGVVVKMRNKLTDRASTST